MKYCILIALSVMICLGAPVFAASSSQHVPLSEIQTQSQMMKGIESLVILNQWHPVKDLLRAREYYVSELLLNQPGQAAQQLQSEHPASSNGLLHPPMAWELLSMVPDARLYSVFTAADLGGYGDNNPPYEPSNPSPADGATNVSRETVNLTWIGGDPDAGDLVYYDLYFGTSAVPPLYASNLTMTSYTVTSLVPGTVYNWKIVARDNWDAETEGPDWSFTTQANNPPSAPVNPIPSNGATEVDRNANLSWECNDPDVSDTLLFDVYFGTSNPPPMAVSNISALTYDPGEMTGGVMYYWQIVARDTWDAETPGPVWYFTTSTADNQPPYTPSDPFPVNGSTGVDINLILSWQGGDPDAGDTVSYDLYFGETSNPPLEARNLTATSYSLQTLEQGRLYYWFIIARDSHSAETEGPLWNFVTYMQPTPTPPNPTPTPEPCVEYSVTLDMGSNYFCPGDTCYLDAIICNPGEPQYLPLWIILDIEGLFWFAPSWSSEIDYYISSPIPSGWSRISILPPFAWPNIDHQYSGAIFWGAMTTTQFSLLGNYDSYTFGWGPCL
ncbi:fibronectin type III domain-containing protein [bacterium]|nr:fibronectin type III domain-containing protein [candidate division CSSED10-310 bacterium]